MRPTASFAIGPGATPQLRWGQRYEPIPSAVMDLRWKRVEFELRGLGARANRLGTAPGRLGSW